MAIARVISEINGVATELTYNPETGYYEGEILAPNIPSALRSPSYYPLTITATSDTAATKTITANIIVVPDFIYDRTQADIDLIKELREKYLNGTITSEEIETWNTDLKGALNRSDLERNEFNVTCVSEQLELGLTTKYDIETNTYNIQEIPGDVLYFKNLLDNIVTIYNTGYHYDDTPEPPELDLTHFEKWNAIERILHDAFYIAWSKTEGNIYCGEIYTGEDIALL